MTNWLSSLPHRAIGAVRAHPIVTTLFVLGTIAWLGFGFIIGGLPFFGLLFLVVAGASWLVLMLQRRRRDQRHLDRELSPDDEPAATARRDGLIVIGIVAIVALVIFGLIQLVPFGRPQKATAGTGEPKWATPQTRELMVRACFSCHSNEVSYPWYSSVAPVSWVVQHHIDEGRGAVNYSNFATNPQGGHDSIEVIQDGSMPPGYFTAFGLHPEAKLTDAEKAELIAGLQATPGFQGGGQGRRGEPGDHER